MFRPSITDSRKQVWKHVGLAFLLAGIATLAMMLTARAEDAPPGVYQRAAVQPVAKQRYAMRDSNGNVIGGRPSGCPHRFCGCEASLYLFGRIIPELNLAWNWAVRFQRAAPGPRMAAVRHGHVMVLISHVSGSDWLVHDGNSGGGKTREHVRSIAGYVIVDPQAPRIREASR